MLVSQRAQREASRDTFGSGERWRVVGDVFNFTVYLNFITYFSFTYAGSGLGFELTWDKCIVFEIWKREICIIYGQEGKYLTLKTKLHLGKRR